MMELPSTRIDEKAIKAWRITSILYGLLLFIIPGFFYFVYMMGDMPALIPIIAAPITVTIYVLIITLFPKIRWTQWRYDVSEQGVDMHRGIIIRKRTVVPMNRIQHVDTKQGPIYRKFKLSSISISTAATTHEIPALDDETALHLRTMISELVRKVKDDV